jgi:hypothetical protein
VIAPGQLIAGAIVAAALLAYGIVSLPAAALAGPAVGAIAILLTGVQLGTVRLTVSPEYIRVAQGPWAMPGRLIPASAVRDARAGNLSFLQTFGIGVPFRWKTTRLTIRPGPTLELVLSDGEHIRVSTADPVAAALLITGERHTATHPGTATGKGEPHV